MKREREKETKRRYFQWILKKNCPKTEGQGADADNEWMLLAELGESGFCCWLNEIYDHHLEYVERIANRWPSRNTASPAGKWHSPSAELLIFSAPLDASQSPDWKLYSHWLFDRLRVNGCQNKANYVVIWRGLLQDCIASLWWIKGISKGNLVSRRWREERAESRKKFRQI